MKRLLLTSFYLVAIFIVNAQNYTIYFYPDPSRTDQKFALRHWEHGNEHYSAWSDWMTAVPNHNGWYQVSIPSTSNEFLFYGYSQSVTNPDWTGNYLFSTTCDGINTYYVDYKGWQDSFFIPTSGSCGSNLVWNMSNGVLIISGYGVMTNYSNGFNQTAPWYTYRDSIFSILIGDSVTSLGDYAFLHCNQLDSIHISNSVTSIGANCFEGCSNLSFISFPNNISSIEYETFFGCTKLASVTIPSSVTRIAGCAFERCTSLTSIIIPSGVRQFGTFSPFQNCSNLTSIYFENPQPIIGRSIECLFDSRQVFVYVPCGSDSAYKAFASSANQARIKPYLFSFYEFNVSANDTTYGQVMQNIPEFICDTVTIEAVPYYGHHFDRWSNGETMNPYSLLVTQNTTITAVFGKDSFSLRTQAADSTQGQTFGDTTALFLDKISIRAVSAFGYEFAQWSDGNTENPRVVELTRDTLFTAEFTPLFPGQCGDNLFWTFSNDTLVIWGSGDMYDYSKKSVPWMPIATAIQEISLPSGITSIAEGAFYRCGELKSVSVPNSVTTIGARAFIQCTALGTVTLGSALNTIGDYGFAYCTGIQTITSYNTTPPAVKSNTFQNVPSTTIVYVPASALNSYKQHNVWGQFDVRPIESDIRLVNGNTSSPHKTIDNGQLYIFLPDGTRYDATGKKVE